MVTGVTNKMKYKLLGIFIFIFLAHCINLYIEKKPEPEIKTYEIKDEITGKTHIFYEEPRSKKNVMFYCLNDKEHKVIWIDWHPNQTPEYTYQVDSYENYTKRTWLEQSWGYKIK